MARALRDEQMTPADELRLLLTESEKRVANLRGSGQAALDLLEDMDRIAELWPQLEAAGMDLRPEAGRWDTIQAGVRKQARTLLSESQAAQRAGATVEKRSDEWWWHADAIVRQDDVDRIRRGGTIVGVIVLLGAVLIFLANRFTDPVVSASMSAMLSGQQKIENGQDFSGALAGFQEATRLTPDDVEAWLWLGVTQHAKYSLSNVAGQAT